MTRMCFFPSAMISNLSDALIMSGPLDHMTFASRVRTHSNRACRFSGTVTSFRGTAKSSSISANQIVRKIKWDVPDAEEGETKLSRLLSSNALYLWLSRWQLWGHCKPGRGLHQLGPVSLCAKLRSAFRLRLWFHKSEKKKTKQQLSLVFARDKVPREYFQKRFLQSVK